MGRKKKKSVKPWCWYCNREFEDEKILLQHQKAKHFKCHICHRKLFTGPGLQIHCLQVHKENIEKVPNSIKGRDDITLEICGMDNVPEEDLIEHQKLKAAGGKLVDETGADSDSDDGEPVKPQSPKPTGSIHGPLPHIPPTLPPPSSIGSNVTTANPMMMMNPMMMSYPHMMYPHMMMNPHMMMPPGMAPPPPPPPHLMMQQPPLPPQPPPPLMSQQSNSTQSTQQPPLPPPLMGVSIQPPSLLMNTVPQPPLSNTSSDAQPPKPLFPAAASVMNDSYTRVEQTPSLPNKIENFAPGTKIIHPEEDISLEEYRARHQKYKYIPSEYSASSMSNLNIRASYNGF